MVTKKVPKTINRALSAPADRKQRIVDAAIKCFIKNGISQTRFAEVAAEAQIDQPLIHYYFPKNEDLYRAVIDVVLGDLKERSTRWIKSDSDAAGNLREYVRGTLSWPQEKPGYFSIWIYFYYLATFQQDFYALNRAIREGGRDRINLIVYQGMEQGLFKKPDGMTVPDLALIIQGILTGNAIIGATEGPKFPVGLLEERTVSTIFQTLGYRGNETRVDQ